MRGLRWIATLLVPPPAVLYGPPSYTEAFKQQQHPAAARGQGWAMMITRSATLHLIIVLGSFLFCFFLLIFLFKLRAHYIREDEYKRSIEKEKKTMLRSSPTSHGIKGRQWRLRHHHRCDRDRAWLWQKTKKIPPAGLSQHLKVKGVLLGVNRGLFFVYIHTFCLEKIYSWMTYTLKFPMSSCRGSGHIGYHV